MNKYDLQMALLVIKGIMPYALSRIEDMQDSLPDGEVDEATQKAINAYKLADEFLSKHR